MLDSYSATWRGAVYVASVQLHGNLLFSLSLPVAAPAADFPGLSKGDLAAAVIIPNISGGQT